MTDRGNIIDTARIRALARSGESRRLRILANLSLADVARETGTTESTIQRWETGQARVSAGERGHRYARIIADLAALERQAKVRAS